MGTHPIFESDFDCLTEMTEIEFNFDFSDAGNSAGGQKAQNQISHAEIRKKNSLKKKAQHEKYEKWKKINNKKSINIKKKQNLLFNQSETSDATSSNQSATRVTSQS